MAKTTSTKTRTVLPRAVPKWKPDPLLDVDSLPVDILAGIGKLLAWWGYLQFQLGVVLREGCNWSKETGRLVTTDSNLRPLTRMLRVLVGTDHWIKDRSLREDIRALADAVDSADATRNDYAHGVFGSGEKPGTFVRHLFKTHKNRVVPQVEMITVQLLESHTDQARELWRRAQQITRTLKQGRANHQVRPVHAADSGG